RGLTENDFPSPRTPNVCEECVKEGTQWVALRECKTCGHVGCCDSSPRRHATKHFHATRHPVIRSVMPGESWTWCYVHEVTGELDAQAVLARRDEFVNNWDDSNQVKWLNQTKIQLARGHGRLTGERQVSVTDNTGAITNLTARCAVVICTGSRPAIPNVPGL